MWSCSVIEAILHKEMEHVKTNWKHFNLIFRFGSAVMFQILFKMPNCVGLESPE